MNKICLVVIYNHKYEKNIPVIDRIYKGRFSHVYHVMPFAETKQQNVIGVYESAYQFQGYVAQAARVFRSDEYTHYVFVADDMVLAPHLNENNVVDVLSLNNNTAFISSKPEILTRSKAMNWIQGMSALAFMNQQGNACEWHHELPSIEEAREKFELAGLDWKDGVDVNFWRYAMLIMRAGRLSPYMLRPLPLIGRCLRFVSRCDDMVYPMAYGYSDFCVIPNTGFDKFVHYSGVLSAMRVFVEVAIPTAMILSCKNIRTLADIGMKAEDGVVDYKVRERIESSANLSYTELLKNFPKDYLYIHPVKLSKWKDLP